MWISNTTSTDLWLFYFRHVQTCSCMLRHVVASLNMPEIEPPQTFCLVVREPPQISNINDTLLGCICVPLTACWWTGGTYWWLYHESHSAPHVTLCAWLYVQTWQLSLHQITFQLKGKFEHLEQSSKTDMVALINECAGQGNLAGIQGWCLKFGTHRTYQRRNIWCKRSWRYIDSCRLENSIVSQVHTYPETCSQHALSLHEKWLLKRYFAKGENYATLER